MTPTVSKDAVVELEGVNGEWFTLAGPNEGDRGVYLGTGVTGLYDPPVKTVYEEPGNYPGARYLSHRIQRRDVVFGVEILNDREGSWMSRDSEWRKAWAFDRDCKLYVTTPESGTRYLKLRLAEQMDISLFQDPNGLTLNRAGMVCVAGDPFWYQDDVIYEAETQTDTRFNPTAYPYPWPYASLPKETLTITVDPSDGKGGLNPTDQYIFPKWVVPASQEEPSEPYISWLPWLGAPASPATIWTIPDYKFELDPDDPPSLATRRVRLPGLIGGIKTAEVQVITVKGSSGYYRLHLNGHSTNSIKWNASANTVKSEIELMPGVGYGNIEITGGPQFLQATRPYAVAFKGGPLAGTDVPLMTVTVTSGNPQVSVATATEGWTAAGENAKIDTDPRAEQISAENGAPLWSRMNGVRFRHPIPPWTRSKTFVLEVSGCAPGQIATLRLPRPWSRPWGLE